MALVPQVCRYLSIKGRRGEGQLRGKIGAEQVELVAGQLILKFVCHCS
jgi:hypothetical protein